MPNDAGSEGDEWHEIDRKSSQVGEDFERTFVLGITPHVARDAVHNEYLLHQAASNTMPLTFLPGQALYSDAQVIVTRQRELREARMHSQ
jgi:hypothetical protein